MDSNVFCLKSQSQMLSFSSPRFLSPRKSPKQRPVICSKMMNMGGSPAMKAILGFKNLLKTFTVTVQRAENRALNVPLISPFTIASSRLEMVENVAIRVELINGCVGWGEAPILPFVTAEDQITAMAKASEACDFLKQSPARSLGSLLGEIGRTLPGHEFASVRAGVEMALIDAVAKSIDIPLWKLFGGVSNSITTDITIPIMSPAEAAELATKYRKQGFKTLKLKVGKNLNSDIEVLQAIKMVHPDCLFILDANEGYTMDEATEVLKVLHEMGATPVLFEQPVHRENWEALGHVTRVGREKYGVSVVADESCRNLDDVKRIIKDNLADVINIKLAKVGVIGALDIIEVVNGSGLALMIGGMVETRLAMGFAGHLAAGSLIWIRLFCCRKIRFSAVMKLLVQSTSSQTPAAMGAPSIGMRLHDGLSHERRKLLSTVYGGIMPPTLFWIIPLIITEAIFNSFRHCVG